MTLAKTGKIFALASNLAVSLVAFYLPNGTAATEPDLSANYADGSAELRKLCADSQNWTDYSCLSEMHNFKPNKTTISASRVFFKRGPMLRLEVVGGGYRDGTIIVKARDGKITARGGPWMGGIQMNLDSDSRMLILPSGINVTRGDFPELFASLKQQVEQGLSCRLGPITDNAEVGQKVQPLEFRDGSNTLKVRVLLSAEHLPVRWETYRAEGKTQTWIKNLKINTGLSDDLFKM